MNSKTARDCAINAFLWLSGQEHQFQTFLNVSGASIEDLKNRTKDPEFLSFILDFFMTSDELILKLSEDLNISPEHIQMARSVLSGGDEVHWT